MHSRSFGYGLDLLCYLRLAHPEQYYVEASEIVKCTGLLE